MGRRLFSHYRDLVKDVVFLVIIGQLVKDGEMFLQWVSKNLLTVPPHWSYFARATARPWVGHLGCFGYILVEEGLGFFLRYCGPKWVDGKVFKNRVEN